VPWGGTKEVFLATAVLRQARNLSEGTGGMDINATERCMRRAFLEGRKMETEPVGER